MVPIEISIGSIGFNQDPRFCQQTSPIRNLVNKHEMLRTCIMRQLDRRGSTSSGISIRIGTHIRHLIGVNTSADIIRRTDLNIITSFALGKMLVSILLSKFYL